MFGLAPQQAGAHGVEGAQPQIVRLLAEQLFQAGFHLAGGLVGEGHRQDVVRAHLLGLHQVGNAVGQHAGLAGARPGQHQDLARPGGHGLALLRVERIQEREGVFSHRGLIVIDF